MKSLWQILVPQVDRTGFPIPVPIHNLWDAKVMEITGGLTIHRSAKGGWVSGNGEWIIERMIPVTIYCDRINIWKIVLMTKEFYEQEKVMYWKISDEVEIV